MLLASAGCWERFEGRCVTRGKRQRAERQSSARRPASRVARRRRQCHSLRASQRQPELRPCDLQEAGETAAAKPCAFAAAYLTCPWERWERWGRARSGERCYELANKKITHRAQVAAGCAAERAVQRPASVALRFVWRCAGAIADYFKTMHRLLGLSQCELHRAKDRRQAFPVAGMACARQTRRN